MSGKKRKKDFKRLVLRIKDKTGWTYEQMGQVVGVPSTTIHSIIRGKSTDPKYSLGHALVELERQVC